MGATPAGTRSCLCSSAVTNRSESDCGCDVTALGQPAGGVPGLTQSRQRRTATPGVNFAGQGRGVGSLVPAGPLQPRYVDIYLSAGPHENYAYPPPADYRSCNNDDAQNCSLWRLRWDLKERRPTEWGLVAAQTMAASPDGGAPYRVSYVQPALSASGERLAYVRLYHDHTGKHFASALIAQDLSSGESKLVELRTAGADQPQFPAWADEGWLLFDSSPGVNPDDMATLWAAYEWPDFLYTPSILGPGGAVTSSQTTGYEDPNVHQSAADTGGWRVVTFGGAAGERIPRVTSLTGADENVVDVVGAGWTADNPDTAPECHHPAFNKSGDVILCTRQEPAETYLEDAAVGPQSRRRLYGFTWTGSAWSNGQPLVGPLSNEDFGRIAKDVYGGLLSDVFPPLTAFDGAGCRNYVWKFGEFCSSDRYVVATVFCIDNLDPFRRNVLNSRVVLIDLDRDNDATGSPGAYHDLTSWIEYYQLADAGTWNGIYATCHRADEP